MKWVKEQRVSRESILLVKKKHFLNSKMLSQFFSFFNASKINSSLFPTAQEALYSQVYTTLTSGGYYQQTVKNVLRTLLKP
mmetsp:Transcript_33095/g.51976  ORF Transcript_33095/g.51976 Transcript_33095/m.51976 type:complete len:81 (+) Transcript_33095:203-445(+)